MAEPVEIILGATERERVVLRVLGRSHGATDYWDGNWVRVVIAVSAGAFDGKVTCDLRAEELVAFRTELERLHRTVKGEANFSTMEGWLELALLADPQGHIHLTGRIFDRAGRWGNDLGFRLDLDQSYLPPIIDALKSAEAAWPVQGRA